MSKEQGHEAALEGLDRARRRGLDALKGMVADGTLISTDEFAGRRSWTTLAMHLATRDGCVFSVPVGGRDYLVAMLAELPERFMFDLCSALSPLSPGEQIVFLLRRHGGLGGNTVLTAFERGAGDRILELARDHLDERGGP